MAFRFKSASSVAVGAFNIYIIQPNWLAQAGIVPPGTKFSVKVDLNRPGVRLDEIDSRIRWLVRPDRLMLETDSPLVDCGTPLSKVLEVLKWTPLLAVGTNLEFEGDVENLENLKVKLPIEPESLKTNVVQQTVHVAVASEPQTFNVQLNQRYSTDAGGSSSVVLNMNVHTDLAKENNQLAASEMAQSACRSFQEHAERAKKLAMEFFGAELES